jgi:hypothetical protein
MLIPGSSGSLAAASSLSLTGMRETGAGDELWTTIAGVEWASGFLIWLRSEFVREREPERPSEPAGGGERRRGEMGQRGVESPELEPVEFFEAPEGLTVSADEADDVVVSCGMLVEDSARWMAAAEGELLELGPRLGLTSVLCVRERRPARWFEAPGAVVRWCGRAGEASREDKGDFGDGEADALGARAPASVFGCFIGADEAVGVLWGAAVGAAAWSVGDTEGSADSSVPVMERKSASLAALMVMLFRRLAAGALVACWVQCARVCCPWGGECNGSLDTSVARRHVRGS